MCRNRKRSIARDTVPDRARRKLENSTGHGPPFDARFDRKGRWASANVDLEV
jgi:hypothetical protein